MVLLLAAFSSWDMFALRGVVELGIHVVFNVFEESLELDVGINRSDINGDPIASAENVVE